MPEKIHDLIADLMGELRHRLDELERRVTALELALVEEKRAPEVAPEHDKLKKPS